MKATFSERDFATPIQDIQHWVSMHNKFANLDHYKKKLLKLGPNLVVFPLFSFKINGSILLLYELGFQARQTSV